MIKSYLFLFILINVIYSCSTSSFPDKPYATATDSTFSITLRLTDIDTGKIILDYESVNGDFKDTAEQNIKGYYIFTGLLKEPQLIKLRLLSTNSATENTFFMENNFLEVSGQWYDRKSWKWKGSKVPADYDEYQQLTGDISSAISTTDSLISVFQESDMDTEAIVLSAKIDSLLKEKRKITKTFIANNPHSPVSLNQLLLNFYANATPPEIKEAYESLDTAVQRMPDGQYFLKEVLTPALNTDIGKPAPGFTLPDKHGKVVSLSSFKGKYVLIDFWASWCVPCRKAIPELRQIYNDYENKSFELLSVSLDNRKEPWLAAMNQDKHTWTSLGDGKGFLSPVAADYGVKAIPYTIMIDKDGKVVARNPSADEIKEILSNSLLPLGK